ncbi:hypothetical protein BDQ17DRAFT_1426043 [Cyathus striatus]|nr:hypothetical protein BDQ17DRAFT_1426043 [Cyathus striatus]
MSSPTATYDIVEITDLNGRNLRLAPPTSRANEAISVLLDAFKDDVIANNLVGGREELRKMTMTTVVRATIVGGKLYVALDPEANVVVGTACWFPPRSDFLADEKQQQQGAGELFTTLQSVDAGLHTWWMSTLLPTLSGVTNKYLGKNAQQNYKMENWSLYSLSVSPKYQGKGISRLLVKVGEDQAAAQGVTTCFETDNENNIAIYKHLGYKDAGFDYVPGPPGLPGYNLHVMVKGI